MKKTIYLLIGLWMICLSSCTDNSYINAIPGESTALISMNPARMSGINNVAVLKTLLHMTNFDKSGIDASHRIFLFESPDGNLGLCAKVDDADHLNETFKQLSGKGLCPNPVKRKGFHFTVLKDAWVAGWSDKAILVMGPVTVDAQAALQLQIAQYLKQDDDEGITSSKLFTKLDSIDAPMSMVAQAAALPDQFIAPFTLGAPKDADASQVLIAAEMNIKQQVMHINGETFSFNPRVNEALKSAHGVYRPIQGKYVSAMPADAMLGMFLNVDGKKFLPLMQSNKGIQALLTGINTAIDMDNIIRSVDGDMAIITPSFAADKLSMSMTAQLNNTNWTKDINDWKKSCPAGGKIIDWKPNAWAYTSDKTSFYFGFSNDKQFFSGSSKEEAEKAIYSAKQQLPAHVKDMVKGQKLVMIINMAAMSQGKSGAVTAMLSPVFGNINTIVYTLK